MPHHIRTVQASDAARLAEIYNYYIKETIITFELEPINAAEMETRIANISDRFPYLILEEDGIVIGYAYCFPWKGREAYNRTVESAIYLDHEAVGKGHGKRLYSALIEEAKLRGYHSMIGGIALPNDVSIRLHESLGFKKAAHFEEMGFKFGKWIDTPYWQLRL